MTEPLKSRRLATVARVAEHREQAAAGAFARCQQELARQEARLAELQVWWHDYALPLAPGGVRQASAALMRDGRAFMARLDLAIGRQREQIEATRRALEAARARWLALRMEAEALDKLVGRAREEEGSLERRRDQHEQDECASRLAGMDRLGR